MNLSGAKKAPHFENLSRTSKSGVGGRRGGGANRIPMPASERASEGRTSHRMPDLSRLSPSSPSSSLRPDRKVRNSSIILTPPSVRQQFREYVLHGGHGLFLHSLPSIRQRMTIMLASSFCLLSSCLCFQGNFALCSLPHSES